MFNRLNLQPVISKTTNWKQVELGEKNLERIKEYFRTHLCATQRECAKELNISDMAVNRHVRSIRKEWRNKSS